MLSKESHLPPQQRPLVRYIERVVMVGYPNGLWDDVNEMPIIRQGITATHALLDYQGRKEFVIDMTCLPGSSGSPVFLYEDGVVRGQAPGSIATGTRCALLGILWGGPQISMEGRIEIRPVPHAVEGFTVTLAPMNLGYVLSAERLTELSEETLRRLPPS